MVTAALEHSGQHFNIWPILGCWLLGYGAFAVWRIRPGLAVALLGTVAWFVDVQPSLALECWSSAIVVLNGVVAVLLLPLAWDLYPVIPLMPPERGQSIMFIAVVAMAIGTSFMSGVPSTALC